jgi:hypothetical protein
MAINIIMGIFALYMIVVFFAMGLFLDTILETVPLEENPPQLFGGVTVYLFLAGLLIRFLIQPLNRLNVNTYKMLPISYNTLSNYLVFKPFLNPINYLPLIVIIPFAIKSVTHYYDRQGGLLFILLFVLLIMSNVQLSSFLKRVTGGKLGYTLIFAVIFAGIIMLDTLHFIPLFKWSEQATIWLIQRSYRMLIPVAWCVLTTLLHRHYFFRNYYTDVFIKKNDTSSLKDFTLFNRFGTVGIIMNLETKLIFRHKRSKNIFLMAVIFLCYGLLFYTNPLYGFSTKIMCGVFVTGMAMMMFGQWVFGWDSNYFDFILSKNISTNDYVKANYYLMLVLCILSFIFSSPYFFFGREIMFIQVVAFLFNVGISLPLFLFFGTYNTKRVDLKNSSAMNFQGTTFKNFLLVLPVLFLPTIIAFFVGLFADTSVVLWVIGVTGMSGILLQKPVLQLCEKQFIKKKYDMADGFRAAE